MALDLPRDLRRALAVLESRHRVHELAHQTVARRQQEEEQREDDQGAGQEGLHPPEDRGPQAGLADRHLAGRGRLSRVAMRSICSAVWVTRRMGRRTFCARSSMRRRLSGALATHSEAGQDRA